MDSKCPVSSIMSTNVVSVNVDDLLSEVESLFEEQHMSHVPVLDSYGKCFGVISQSDLNKQKINIEKFKSLHAWEICSHNVLDVPVEQTILEAARLLVNTKVHHLLVKDKGRVAGLISSIDIVKEYIDQNKQR